MNSTIIFQMCERDIEHLLHIFFDCKFAKDCWQVMNLEFNMANVENASDWLLQKLSGEPKDVNVQIATVLWGIWYARNLKVWDSKRLTA